MEKMAGHTRLYRRGATYYHRATVPLDIQETYPKTEETFSLKTKDHAEALRRVRSAAVDVDRKFDAHRRSLKQAGGPPLAALTDAQIEHIAALYFISRLEEDEEVRKEGFFEDEQTPLPTNSFKEHVDMGKAFNALNRKNAARGKADEFFYDEIADVLSWDDVNLRLAENSPSRDTLARALQAATIRAHDMITWRNRGDIVETPKLSAVNSRAPLLSQAVDEWIAEKSISAWTPKTKEEKIARLAQFKNVTGDKPLDQYGKDDGRRFKQVLLSIPPNWTKYERFKGMSMEAAAETAKAGRMPGMEENTVKKAINSVSAFWNWAVAHYDYIERNPLKGLNIRVKASARDERDPFSTQDLQHIFSSPLYTGCRSLHNWKDPGTTSLRDSGLFWVPLIGLFTGARMGEIVQLYTSDVRKQDGILFFDINDDAKDKHLKNANSRRRIPVHDELIKIGFQDFVTSRVQAGETRLFPDIEAGSDGHYSSRFSKHFSRFLEDCLVKRPKVSFHSFRHSFEDACRNSYISKEIMDALQGHGQKGMAGRYGAGFDLTVLSKAMHDFAYPELSLRHLYIKKRD